MPEKKVFVTRIIVPDAISKLEQNFEVEIWDQPVLHQRNWVYRKHKSVME